MIKKLKYFLLKMNRVIEVSEPWFSLIRDGIKKVEGRKGSPTWVDIKIGDVIISNGKEKFKMKIVGINKYYGENCLENYLKTEKIENVLPGIGSIEEGMKIYMSPPINWTQQELNKYGILAFQLSFP